MYSWIERTPTGSSQDRDWFQIASNADGKYRIISDLLGKIYTSDNFGVTWTLRQPAGAGDKQWRGVCISGDGSKMIAIINNGRCYMSTNYGVNWQEIQPAGDVNKYWYKVEMDYTGQHIIIAERRVYISNNYGVDWLEKRPDGDSDKFWYGLAINVDGSVIYAVHKEKVFITENLGETWNDITPIPDILYVHWRDVHCSADGSIVMVGIYVARIDSLQTGRLHLSTNKGVSWQEIQPAGDVQKIWSGIRMTADGQRIIVCSYMSGSPASGRVYYSSNGGLSWNEEMPAGDNNKFWISVSINSDGKFANAIAQAGRVYTGLAGFMCGFFIYGETLAVSGIGKTIVTVPGENGLADIDFTATNVLYNNIWISLMTRKRSRFDDLEFGSRLHELKLRGGKLTAGALVDAKMWAEQALQWLVTVGRAKSIDVSVVQNAEIITRVDFSITVLSAINNSVTYSIWYDVI